MLSFIQIGTPHCLAPTIDVAMEVLYDLREELFFL